MKPPLVLVIWTDTITNSSWKRGDEVDKWAAEQTWQVHSAGYLLRKTKDFIIIAASYAKNENQFMGLAKIPRRWAKIIPLDEPKGV